MALLEYDILVLAARDNKNKRTLGDLFNHHNRPLPDISVSEALNWLLKTITGLSKKFAMETAVLDEIFDEFIKTLPSSFGKLLNKA